MPFFQNSVINKHLKTLDKEAVSASYEKFKEYFHNPEIQQNIREAKEEQFQEGFLRELFVNILGYTINPNPEYNLTTEFKNEKGAKKADGAILQNGKAIAVIELKGTDTKDLDKINAQAFNYKNNQSGCVYVITSNFEKLRFFIHNSVDHLEFNLFTLTEQEFQLLWLCLSADSLFSGVPLKAKKESLVVEENITKQLYKDYSTFKTELWQNLVKNSPDADQLLLYKKSQKLLDRFLFIFFAEDSGLLPPNSISRIVERWGILKEEDAYKPLYDIFKQFFGYINVGRKGKAPQDDIFEYNGGLFLPDDLLDSFIIDDELLQCHVMKLTSYDFQTEVDVNILGHIFENSLNEIENVTARLQGQEVDKSKTKRKKEGVFYTPKYITKYIVENTVGKLCQEKKFKLGIIDEEYAKGRRHRQHEVIRRLNNSLQEYRNWLLNITICDPACGSGAFLNTALEYLINEHAYIDELYAQLHGASIIFQDVSNHILEHNLYGVDINEESIEIAKLSLWLRTAQRGRKLTSLNNNLKCGNSLIDDPEFAGEKAFKWQEKFRDVFANGGFDVVIGNPPYVNFANLPVIQREYFKKHSEVCKNKTDLYAFFIERSTQILKFKGRFSFIFPHTWVSTTSFTPLRKLLFKNYRIDNLVELEHGVFSEAIVKTVIIVCTKDEYFSGVPIFNEHFDFIVKIPRAVISEDDEMVINFDWTPKKQIIEDKIFNSSEKLGNLLRFTRGIKTSNDSRFLHFEKKNDDYKKVIRGRNIKAYRIDYEGEYIWYRPDLMKEKVGCLPHTKELFEVDEKLITQRVNSSGELLVTYDTEKYYCLDTTNVSVKTDSLTIDLKYLLVILNSKLINWWFNDKFKMPTISGYELHQIPIKVDKNLENIFIEYANIKLNQASKFKLQIQSFLRYIESQFSISTNSKKFQEWYKITFGEFIKELNKTIKISDKEKLSKVAEIEWMELFEAKKFEVSNLKFEIDKIDKEIDQMVYELYGLTGEEIRIVEES